MDIVTIHSPIGPLTLYIVDKQLLEIRFSVTKISTHCQYPKPLYDKKEKNQPLTHKLPAMANVIIEQLMAYFQNPCHQFRHFFWQYQGSCFQQSVWQAIEKIPLGQTSTYGQLASQLNTSPRAIGQACRYNPIPIIIPCHRVVAKNNNGGYHGYANGPMLAIKQWLLAHEKTYH